MFPNLENILWGVLWPIFGPTLIKDGFKFLIETFAMEFQEIPKRRSIL